VTHAGGNAQGIELTRDKSLEVVGCDRFGDFVNVLEGAAVQHYGMAPQSS
jgi:hypothetical protein